MSLKDQHLQQFWGKWLRKDQEQQQEQQASTQKEANEEWVDSSDLEPHDDDAWGLRRPSARKEQEIEDDMFDSDWDDDDDDSGGHMMPVPEW